MGPSEAITLSSTIVVLARQRRASDRSLSMSYLAHALLADLDDEALDHLAELLASRLTGRLDKPDGALLTPAQAAARLSVHPKTLTRAAAAGRVRGATRVGRAWRFAAADLALEPPSATVPMSVPTGSARKGAGGGAAAAIRAGGITGP
jgi:excisionase family DNA binding protein